jgi:hypothetical protein
MESFEVRIGNFVMVPQIDSKVLIPSVPKIVKGITALNEFEFAGDHFDTTIKIPSKHCKGIHLLPEHLEFLGFKKMNEFQYVHKVLEMTLDDFKEFFVWNIQKNLVIRIESLHHLQNLIADMTTFGYMPDFKPFFHQYMEV